MSDPDKSPGFWPDYVPPKSAVSKLVQGPSYLIDGYSLADAVMSDWRKAMSAARDLARAGGAG